MYRVIIVYYISIFTHNGGENGGQASNLPFRGRKAFLFEGGVHVTAFASGGAVNEGGYTHNG